MERVNRILWHPLFRECLRQIGEAEQERIYCKHDMRHFLDVARLAWIANLEQGLGFDEEIIYAAALLHDIGRAKQYACGMPHDIVSAELIRQIMPECGFSADETAAVAAAVEGHSQSRSTVMPEKCENYVREYLGSVLKEADHISRSCFDCDARESCYWTDERKNLKLQR
ncbi:MAG TPA: hypothetical protein DF613_13680 [Lachnospiraceae bacterium]|nr:hypothetical protein [Lachnospiraceae bacterium]